MTKKNRKDEAGSALIAYALCVASVAVIVAVAGSAIGGKTNQKLKSAAEEVAGGCRTGDGASCRPTSFNGSNN